MADLIVYIPNHGYANGEQIYSSWLDSTYYIGDKTQHSFKLEITSGAADYVQYTSTVTSGFVRKVATGTTTITGLDHLEGRTVYLSSGGQFIKSDSVTNGQVIPTGTLYDYRVGLPYSTKCKTTRLELPISETTQTKIKKINEITARHYKTQGGSVGIEYDGTEYLQDLGAEFSDESKDTGKLTKGNFNSDAYIVIRSNYPYPMTILDVVVDLDVLQ